jgi:hypothetical protein
VSETTFASLDDAKRARELIDSIQFHKADSQARRVKYALQGWIEKHIANRNPV